MKKYYLYGIYLFVFLIVCGCNERERTKSLGETELYFNERLSSISAESDSSFWIGSENGDIWYMKQKKFQEYNIGSDRIYKIITDTFLNDNPTCWIGIRNSGLQKWQLNPKQNQLIKKFTIPNKGSNYSVYDILRHQNQLYVATSQGLYAMPCSGEEKLQLIYPSTDSETARSGKPFIVNGIQLLNDSLLVCATQDGLLKYSIHTGSPSICHPNKYISSVSVYDQKIYSLANKTLYIEDWYSKEHKEIPLGFSSRVYYKLGNIHYFFDDNLLTLSNDLKHFISVPLRRSIPSYCNNIVTTNKPRATTLLVTESALWNLPLHLGIFYTNAEIIASCHNNKEFYYLNSRNELYRQFKNEAKATKILTFPNDEVITGMMTDNTYLYYICNKHVLKRIKLKKGYLGNVLFSTSETVYQSPTKITAYHLKVTPEGSKIYLGIQDDLIYINASGKAQCISSLNNHYITAFYSSETSENLYFSTLNRGIYYGHDDQFQVIKGTENCSFIRDISVVEGHDPLLMLLTNHLFICREHQDSIAIKGCDRILKANDSLFYALSEFGLTKLVASPKGIKEQGTFFHDIHFTPNAALIAGDTLYLGSNIGIMKIATNDENDPLWINMKNTVPNLKITAILLVSIFIILLLLLEEYLRRKYAKRKITRLHLKDIRIRLNSLLTMAHFGTPQDEQEVKSLQEQLQELNINDKAISKKIGQLSEIIMKKNRDMALVLSQYLNQQIHIISNYNSFDKPLLIKASQEALSSNNLEEIVAQAERNKAWIQTITHLQERLTVYISSMRDAVCIENLTEKFNREINMLIDDISRKELSNLQDEIELIEQHFTHLYSDDGLSEIDRFLVARKHLLLELESDEVISSLCSEIEHIRKEMSGLERIQLLKQLNPIDQHIQQLILKEKIAAEMGTYTSLRWNIEQKNEERITPKFGADLAQEIAENTKQSTDNIDKYISAFYESLQKTDHEIIDNILEFTSFRNQPAKVLALLIANPKVKRLYIPGMLCIYGNLNPVISRLMNNKLKVHAKELEKYIKSNPTSIALYLANLIKHS